MKPIKTNTCYDTLAAIAAVAPHARQTVPAYLRVPSTRTPVHTPASPALRNNLRVEHAQSIMQLTRSLMERLRNAYAAERGIPVAAPGAREPTPRQFPET